MSSYVLCTSSTADLTNDMFKARNIPVVHFHYEMDGITCEDDLWTSRDAHSFYQDMLDGAMTRTSQVNVDEYINFWKPFLDDGKDVLHVALSSGISGTVNSARIAAANLAEAYPDRKIMVIDSLAASGGFGLLVISMADRRDEGYSLEELYNWTENNKKRLHHWFFSTDLTFFIRGGRVSKTAGFFGQMLNICPLLNVDYEGRLIPRDKIRTKKKVIREIVSRMEQHAENGTCYNGKCFITHSDCLDDAKAVAALIEEKFPALNGDVQITDIGPTIGAHTGPGTVALFFWGDERVD